MATYYVRQSGSDTNNGTSPATAWRTIGKALGTGSPVAAGDTVYVGAGVYRETVTYALNPATPITLVGDTSGAYTGDPGYVVWSNYTAGDTAASSTSQNLFTVHNSNLTIENIAFQSGQSGPWGKWGGGTGFVFRRCVFLPGENTNNVFNVSVDGGINWKLTFDQCVFLPNGNSNVMELYVQRNATANDVKFLNCLFLNRANNAVRIFSLGASGTAGGQVLFEGCTFVGQFENGDGAISTTGAGLNGLVVVRGCLFIAKGVALNAGTAGDITEDYNVIRAGTPRINVTAGTNSRVGNTALDVLGFLETAWGMWPRPPFTPRSGSPLLSFAATTTATTDGVGRPRPSGGGPNPAAGWLELHDYAGMSSAANADGGSGTALELTGRMDYDLAIPVDPVSTTISVKVKWDANHGDTNPPQAQLLAAPELGYTGQTLTATAPGTNYQTLTFTAFTPSKKGVVILRLISRSASASGKCWFDTVTVS